jgi:hypothetical protein
MTGSEVFESVTGRGSSDFAILVRILNNHGSWCLIGGLAVNCFVEPVYTLDADLVVVSTGLDAIRSELTAAGFSLQEFPHLLDASMKDSDLRIRFSLDPRYQEFLKDTRRMQVLGEQVPVASLVNVTQGKIWAWTDKERRPTKRKKDELDLMRILEAYPGLRHAMPQEIKDQLPEV